MKINKT